MFSLRGETTINTVAASPKVLAPTRRFSWNAQTRFFSRVVDKRLYPGSGVQKKQKNLRGAAFGTNINDDTLVLSETEALWGQKKQAQRQLEVAKFSVLLYVTLHANSRQRERLPVCEEKRPNSEPAHSLTFCALNYTNIHGKHSGSAELPYQFTPMIP